MTLSSVNLISPFLVSYFHEVKNRNLLQLFHLPALQKKPECFVTFMVLVWSCCVSSGRRTSGVCSLSAGAAGGTYRNTSSRRNTSFVYVQVFLNIKNKFHRKKRSLVCKQPHSAVKAARRAVLIHTEHNVRMWDTPPPESGHAPKTSRIWTRPQKLQRRVTVALISSVTSRVSLQPSLFSDFNKSLTFSAQTK